MYVVLTSMRCMSDHVKRVEEKLYYARLAFLVSYSCRECVPGQVIYIYVLYGLIRWQVLDSVQNFERMPPDKDVRWMNVSCALVCGLSGSRGSGILKVSCMYPSMSVRPELSNGHNQDE